MGKQRDRFQPWIEKTLRPRFPELEASLMAAADAFDAAHESGQLLPEQLRLIVEAACSPRRPLYENACGLLAILSAKHPEANAAILAMSRSRKGHVRFNGILCLGESTPPATLEQVLKSGISDKNARVRSKAADWMGRLRKDEFVPDLAVALASEQDSKVRSTMNFILRLLRDGYILEAARDAGYQVTVYTDDGGVRGQWIGEETLRTQGIDTVAAQLRRPQFPRSTDITTAGNRGEPT